MSVQYRTRDDGIDIYFVKNAMGYGFDKGYKTNERVAIVL